MREARREMVVGCALSVLGAGLVIGLFVIAWGGVIGTIILSAEMATGLAVFARGWSRWRLYRRSPPPLEGETAGVDPGSERPGSEAGDNARELG